MIASKYRFHGYGALKFLFGHGKTFRFKNFSIRVAQNPRRTHSRVGVVISKKVVKAAPKRNRVRRRVYEALRHDWDHILGGHDFIVSAHDPYLLDIDHQALVAELRNALRSAKLWTDNQKSDS